MGAPRHRWHSLDQWQSQRRDWPPGAFADELVIEARRMTGVRFYICPEAEWSEAAKFAARLARQLKRRGHRILFLIEDEARQQALSDLLWQYPADAFLPHRTEPGQAESGMDIAAGQEWDDHHDVLINLTDQVPPNYARFEHLCEVVPSSDTLLANARTRWIHYKDRGHPLKRIETDNI